MTPKEVADIAAQLKEIKRQNKAAKESSSRRSSKSKRKEKNNGDETAEGDTTTSSHRHKKPRRSNTPADPKQTTLDGVISKSTDNQPEVVEIDGATVGHETISIPPPTPAHELTTVIPVPVGNVGKPSPFSDNFNAPQFMHDTFHPGHAENLLREEGRASLMGTMTNHLLQTSHLLALLHKEETSYGNEIEELKRLVATKNSENERLAQQLNICQEEKGELIKNMADKDAQLSSSKESNKKLRATLEDAKSRWSKLKEKLVADTKRAEEEKKVAEENLSSSLGPSRNTEII